MESMFPHHRGQRVQAAGAPARSSQQSSQPSTLEIEFAELSNAGRVRDHNEDYLGHVLAESQEQANSHGWLFALADGVGGHEKGEVASKAAIECLMKGFRGAPSGEQHAAMLQRLVQAANVFVYEAGRAAAPGGVSMATTIVACALRYDRAVVAHVGDSRCYLVRLGHATALTKDHTVAGEQARMGLITSREASKSTTRHLLSRSLGGELFANVDTSEHHVLTGDVLVLCSDGLHGPVHGADIAGIVARTNDLNAAADKLVSLANERDGSDNVSVQLVRIRGVERVGMYRGRPYKLR
jgi:serine/threonine protein phosphatase PrpC